MLFYFLFQITPSVLVLENVLDSDTVFKTQLWLIFYK
jgi:hypothetical protein